MSRENDVDRRTFLQYSGTALGVSVAVAGCLGDDDETPEAGDDAMDGDDGGDDTPEETPEDTPTDTPEDGDDDGEDDGDGDEELAITVTQGTFPTTLDPNAHLDTPTYNAQDQAYEEFLYRDPDGSIIEHIVTDWERTEEQTIELEVRDDVTFHSGNDMTADDVAFSINRTNESDDQGGVIGNIEQAEATDDGTVEVSLGGVEPAIFRNLAAFGRVMERAWTEERDEGQIAEEMNGTGAYELVEFVDDTRVEFERFDDYWGDEPDVDSVTFDAVEDEGTRVDRLVAGESDLIVNVNPADIPTIQDQEGIATEFVPSIRSIFLVMNNVKEPFDSEEFRQAMNYAVDVQAIIDSLLNEFGDRTSQPTLPDHFGHNPDVEPYPYDPEQAEQLVEDSGYADVDITLQTTTGRYLRDTDIAETAAAQIDELGNVNCSAELRDTAALFGETGDGDMETSPAFYLIGWGNPTFDANYTLAPWFVEGQTFQHFDDSEEDVDINDRIIESNQISDEGEREGLLQEINADVRDTAAWVFLHQQYSIYGINEERIQWDARQDEDINVREIRRA